MDNPSRSVARLLALCAVSVFAAAPARAQTVINSLPYVINTSGLYVLTRNLSSSQTSGNLIEIGASNVTVDFQGYYISGPVGNTTQNTYGVYANNRSNITLRNGTVANCKFGVYLTGVDATTTNNLNHDISNLRLTNCINQGIQIDNAPGTTIANCKVSQIGSSSASFAYGINVNGAGTTVQNCVVSRVTSASTSTGIYLDPGSFARQNTVSNCTYGVRSGKYQDNLTYGCATPFNGGTDAGGNN